MILGPCEVPSSIMPGAKVGQVVAIILSGRELYLGGCSYTTSPHTSTPIDLFHPIRFGMDGQALLPWSYDAGQAAAKKSVVCRRFFNYIGFLYQEELEPVLVEQYFKAREIIWHLAIARESATAKEVTNG